MEDDSGIELSLGLSWGKSSSGKFKAKESCVDLNAEGRKSILLDGNLNGPGPSVKHFLQNHVVGHANDRPQRTTEQGPAQQENFWTDLGKRPVRELDASTALHEGVSHFMGFKESLFAANKSLHSLDRPADRGEEKLDQHDVGQKLWPGIAGKRQMPFEDLDNQKKQEKETEFDDALGRRAVGVSLVKSSTVSLTTEEISAADNEDVPEAESEGSTSSTPPSIGRDSIKKYTYTVSDASNQKSKQGFLSSNTVASQGPFLKQTLAAGSDTKVELGNLAYGVPLSLQPLTVATVPYSIPGNASSSAATDSSSGFPLPYLIQLMPPSTNSESHNVKPLGVSNFQFAFGYSSVQLPALRPDSSLGGVSRSQQFQAFSNKSSREGGTTEHVEDEIRTLAGQLPHTASETSCEGKEPDLSKSGIKHQLPDMVGISSSSWNVDIMKSNKPMEASEPLALEAFPREMLPAIRPGIAAEVKFEGHGSYPDLPWVSTVAPGPNGKTISGVAYKYGRNQIKIVCACHGTHMSPDEFVEHAAADITNQGGNIGFSSFPAGNPAASAKS